MLSSDVMNYLIMRYMQESGFSHSAFVFGAESSVLRTTIAPDSVPPGSLIMFVQKGLQYLELEANLDGQVSCRHFELAPSESPACIGSSDQKLIRAFIAGRSARGRVSAPLAAGPLDARYRVIAAACPRSKG